MILLMCLFVQDLWSSDYATTFQRYSDAREYAQHADVPLLVVVSRPDDECPACKILKDNLKSWRKDLGKVAIVVVQVDDAVKLDLTTKVVTPQIIVYRTIDGKPTKLSAIGARTKDFILKMLR